MLFAASSMAFSLDVLIALVPVIEDCTLGVPN